MELNISGEEGGVCSAESKNASRFILLSVLHVVEASEEEGHFRRR